MCKVLGTENLLDVLTGSYSQQVTLDTNKVSIIIDDKRVTLDPSMTTDLFDIFIAFGLKDCHLSWYKAVRQTSLRSQPSLDSTDRGLVQTPQTGRASAKEHRNRPSLCHGARHSRRPFDIWPAPRHNRLARPDDIAYLPGFEPPTQNTDSCSPVLDNSYDKAGGKSSQKGKRCTDLPASILRIAHGCPA